VWASLRFWNKDSQLKEVEDSLAKLFHDLGGGILSEEDLQKVK
jgi:hypothetical protein